MRPYGVPDPREALRLQAENDRLRCELSAATKRIASLEAARAITSRLLISGAPGPRPQGNGPGRTIPVKG